jgi:hypothetical protein
MLAAWPAFAWAYPDDPQYSHGYESWMGTIHWPTNNVPSADVAYPTIAVVDSGIMSGWDEFSSYITPDSADCVSGHAISATSPSVIDDVASPPHGTQVASLAAAPINGFGMVGVSPFSPLVAVRVTTQTASLQVGPVKCALEYLRGLAQSGPLVVNLSMQFSKTDGTKLADDINALVASRALVVAATGNRTASPGTSGVQWPAALPHVMAVGDTEGQSLLAGPQLDVLAPGSNLVLPDAGGNWVDYNPGGTSYSTAIVSGAAALVWGALPDVSNPQIVAYILRRTSSRYQHWSTSTGFGTINIAAALQWAASPRKVPLDDEFEPNDSKPTAFKFRGRTLHGIVGKTDDPLDYWKLTRVRTCPATKRKFRGTSVKCYSTKHGVTIRVKATAPLVAYTLKY